MAILTTRFFSPRVAIILSSVLAWMAIQAIVLLQFDFEYSLVAWDALLYTSSLGIVAFTSVNLIIRYAPQSGRYGFALGLSGLGAWLSVWMAHEALSTWVAEQITYVEFIQQGLLVRQVVHFLVLLGTTLGGILWSEANRKKSEIQQEMDVKSFVKEAELQKLQLQLQPHFLFNSLNSINALILIDPDRARDMVQQLSDFLRATLKRADEQWISLEDEFNYLNLYLAIEKVRFGHRLDVTAELDEQLKLWLIPPLILQPLVENAIKFGLYGTTDRVEIRMTTSREEDHLRVEISNPFDSDVQPASGTGFGLVGLKRRLYLLYARNDLLETRTEGNLYIVQLTLPEKTYEGNPD